MDNRETPERKRIGKELYGDNLHILQLETFDYIIGNNAEIGIESKTVKDLVASIYDKRFENQCYKMAKFRKEHGTHCYFFIQGNYSDIADDPYYSWVTPKTWAGILSSICEPKDMKIITVDSDKMFWVQLERLIYNYCKDHEVRQVNITPNNMSLTARMVACIAGVGDVRAESVAECYTIKELCEIDQKSLLSIDGIGKKYAEKIIKAFQEVS